MRHTPARNGRPDPAHLAGRLLGLVDPRGPSLAGIVRHRRAVQVVLEPLDGLEDLLGRRVPDCWGAVGLLTPGAAMRPGELQPRGIAVAHVSPRRGTTSTAICWGDRVELLEGGVGRADDLCRRMLGLPTPRPDEPPCRFLHRVWVDRVLGRVLDGPPGGAPSAAEVASLRPGPVADWDELRWLCSSGRLELPGVNPVAAAWFDEGSLHRWVLAGLPDPVEALGDLEQLLPAASLEAMGPTPPEWLRP